MFGGAAKQAQRATLIAKIDSLAADIAKMASTHTEVLPLCSQARRPKVMTSSLHDSRHCTPLQSMATMHASLSALQAAEEKRAAAQTEADTISFLRQHVAELTEELEVGFLSLSAPLRRALAKACARSATGTHRARQASRAACHVIQSTQILSTSAVGAVGECGPRRPRGACCRLACLLTSRTHPKHGTSPEMMVSVFALACTLHMVCCEAFLCCRLSGARRAGAGAPEHHGSALQSSS